MFERSVLCQIISALIATLGAMTTGTIIGWSSPSGIILPGAVQFPVTQDDAAYYGSVFGIGAVIGSIPAGWMSNMIGRCYSMIMLELFVIVGWIILTVPENVGMLIVGRILQGIGAGGLCAVLPSYIGEITEPNIRGTLAAMFQVFICIGILYSYVLGSVTNYVEFNVLCGMWAVLHMLGTFLIPESPYYLLSKNKDDEAKASLMRLRDGNDQTISNELSGIKNEIERHRTQNSTFTQVLDDKVNRKSLVIAVGIMLLQETSGVNMIIFHMSYIFQLTKSSISPETSSISVAVVQVLMTCAAMAVIDKLGRRVLLLISAGLISLTCACFAIYFVIIELDMWFELFDWLPLVLFVIYISAFSIGLGPVPWVIMGEIFSNEVKPYGTSLASATNWVSVFLVTYCSNELIKLIGFTGLFITYCVSGIATIGFVWILVPETKTKSFAEIQLELAGNIPSTSTGP